MSRQPSNRGLIKFGSGHSDRFQYHTIALINAGDGLDQFLLMPNASAQRSIKMLNMSS